MNENPYASPRAYGERRHRRASIVRMIWESFTFAWCVTWWIIVIVGVRELLRTFWRAIVNA